MKSLPVKQTNPNGETWEHHRNDFCSRRLSMINKLKNYQLYDNGSKNPNLKGLPTPMHINMLMWGCCPDHKNLMKNLKYMSSQIKKL
jgi:hypothetical protein